MIAYTSQGLLKTRLILNDHRYVEAAVRTSDLSLKRVWPDRRLAGRFDRDWNGAVPWCCLTGMAYSAIVSRRLSRITGEGRYAEAAGKVTGVVKRTRDVGDSDPGSRGGIKGSFSLEGAYGRYRGLNRATKFVIGALLLEEHPDLERPLW